MPAKVVQTERKTKGKLVFLCFSEVQPTFSRSEKVVQTERKTKGKCRKKKVKSGA
jgi:hypothetical protein